MLTNLSPSRWSSSRGQCTQRCAVVRTHTTRRTLHGVRGNPVNIIYGVRRAGSGFAPSAALYRGCVLSRWPPPHPPTFTLPRPYPNSPQQSSVSRLSLQAVIITNCYDLNSSSCRPVKRLLEGCEEPQSANSTCVQRFAAIAAIAEFLSALVSGLFSFKKILGTICETLVQENAPLSACGRKRPVG